MAHLVFYSLLLSTTFAWKWSFYTAHSSLCVFSYSLCKICSHFLFTNESHNFLPVRLFCVDYLCLLHSAMVWKLWSFILSCKFFKCVLSSTCTVMCSSDCAVWWNRWPKIVPGSSDRWLQWQQSMGLPRNLPKGLIHLWCGPWSLQTRFVTHPSLSHSPEPHTVQRTAPRYCQNQIPLHAVWQFLILHQLYSQCPTRSDTLRATGLIMVWLHFLQTILRRQIIHHGIYAWQQVWNVLLPNTNRWDLTNILHTIFTFSFLFFFRRRNRFQWRIYLHPPPPLASSDSHFPRDSQQHYKVFNNSLPLERRAMWDRISIARGPTGHVFILLQVFICVLIILNCKL